MMWNLNQWYSLVNVSTILLCYPPPDPPFKTTVLSLSILTIRFKKTDDFINKTRLSPIMRKLCCQGSFAKMMNCWIPSFLCWSSLWWEERLIFLIEDWAVESPRVKPDRWVSREEASPNQGKTKWSEWSALAFTIRNFLSQLSNWFYAKKIYL